MSDPGTCQGGLTRYGIPDSRRHYPSYLKVRIKKDMIPILGNFSSYDLTVTRFQDPLGQETWKVLGGVSNCSAWETLFSVA